MAEKTGKENSPDEKTLQIDRAGNQDVEREAAGHGGHRYHFNFSAGCCFCPLLAPYGMNAIHAKHALEGPSAQFWLARDNLGRDLLSRIIYGARIS